MAQYIKNGHWIGHKQKPIKPKQTTRTTRTVNEHGVRITVTTRRGNHTEIRSTYKRHDDKDNRNIYERRWI